MILVDTSVWIDYFNGVSSVQTDYLDKLITEGSVVIGDLIYLEILQGIRYDSDYRVTRDSLLTLEQFPLLTPKLADRGARHYRTLRKRGITVRKTADVIIATFCIEQHIPLLFVDRDFLPFVQHLGLKPALKAH